MSHPFKVIGITVALVVYTHLLPTVSAAQEFSFYAESLSKSGIINAEISDAGYRLHDPITRAEMVKVAMKLAGNGGGNCMTDVYSDVTQELGDLCGYIEAAAHSGITSLSYTRFRPSDSVSRAELSKILFAANEIAPSRSPTTFSDVPESLGDLAMYISAGVENGCIKNGSLFRPSVASTRGEVFKMAACVMNQKNLVTTDNSKLVWSDEFNGNSLDPTKWNTETGADGWGNNELQNYTDNTNISLRDGNLTIEARKENGPGAPYSSARINTHNKASWTYGKVEARIRLPDGQGIWPAFWMLGENIDTVDYPECGEMDIVEMIGGKSAEDGSDNERTIWGSIHRPNHDPNPNETVKSITSSFGNPLDMMNWSDDFHVYGIEWDEKTIKHFVDGRIYQTIDISSTSDGFEVFHRPFYIVLNLAVGGNWPGSPDATAVFPKKMVVDWVRVFEK